MDETSEAPPGASLLVSILTRPSAPPRSLELDQLHLVSNAVGVAAALAARRATGADVRLKWPNDLVIDTDAGVRKVSGILAESVLVDGRADALVVGIGINVNWPRALPDELAEIAIALNHVAGAEVVVEDPDLCPRFTARLFEDVTIAPSPAWLKARLSAAGQRPINNVVDVSNYVMLEVG